MADTTIRLEARRLAADMLSRYWDGSIPVDPIRIAMQLGIRVSQAELPPQLAGAIFKQKGTDPVILAEARDHPHRQRFTVAHELGHYARRADRGEDEIDFTDLRSEMAAPGSDVEEIFANEFGASLLMPEDALRPLGRKWRDAEGKPNALFLAGAFKVSEDAMRYRIRNLGIA